MSEIALPTTPNSIRRWIVWLIAPLAFLVAIGGVWLLIQSGGTSPVPGSGRFYTVGPTDFDVTLTYDGELQAVNNIDIISQVEGQTIIQTLVKEGTTVKKGDVLMTLDASAIKQKIEDTVLDLQKAE